MLLKYIRFVVGCECYNSNEAKDRFYLYGYFNMSRRIWGILKGLTYKIIALTVIFLKLQNSIVFGEGFGSVLAVICF